MAKLGEPALLPNEIAVVVIGRNEGKRLEICLSSVRRYTKNIVYVDSASTDRSTMVAEDAGAFLVRLDIALPFTAARARNEGFIAAKRLMPEVRYIQFIDGDCELVPGWLNAALSFIEQRTDIAVVCGRRRERNPEQSIYNRLCDIEWATPIGEANACGGDALVRVAAFEQVGGFQSELLAGEEPDLCRRMRQVGWKIWRIDAEMTRHDAAMKAFRQWWRRVVRGGMANAQIWWLHSRRGAPVSETKYLARSIIWGGLLPLAVGIGAFIHPGALAVLLLYPLRFIRIAARRDIALLDSWQYAFFMTIVPFAQLEGNLRYFGYHLRNKPMSAIEYKETC